MVPERRQKYTRKSDPDELPFISIIITAHNEETRIKAKLDNTLDINYPDDKHEIIVASDCSSDATDRIVSEYSDTGIKLVRADERKGKEYAQLCAIKQSKGEIIVFSDVATQIEQDAIIKLVRHFDDESIGAVSSEDKFVSKDGNVAGEGAYVKYEMWLRRLESARAGLVGLSGSFFAARRQVCEEWDISVPSDFNTALNCANNNLVAISSSDVIGIYQDIKDPTLEYRRKNRTIIRGISAIYKHPEVLNPFKMKFFSFQVWSHKIMRWGEPWFLLMLFLISIVMLGSNWIIDFIFIAQLIFYSLAIVGHFSNTLRNYTIIKIPYFFVQVNIAIAHAMIQFIFGKRITVWEPSKR